MLEEKRYTMNNKHSKVESISRMTNGVFNGIEEHDLRVARKLSPNQLKEILKKNHIYV